VALISVAESLDTSSADARLVLNIMTAVSQWEREAIGERTRDALSRKRKRGERVGNLPFGSRLAGVGQHVEQDPGEQATLSEIRRLREQGTTMRGIATALNRGAHLTRRALAAAWSLSRGFSKRLPASDPSRPGDVFPKTCPFSRQLRC
jgi:site-specific DNA recombinase